MSELKFLLLIIFTLPVFYYTIKFIVWFSEKIDK